jgi:hypothetical protein
LVSPPVQSSHEDDLGQSSEGHLDAGIYSDDHNQLVSPSHEEDEQSATSDLKLKLAAEHDKKVGRNDQITFKGNDVYHL